MVQRFSQFHTPFSTPNVPFFTPDCCLNARDRDHRILPALKSEPLCAGLLAQVVGEEPLVKIDPAKKRSSLALLEPLGQALEPLGVALEQLGQAFERRMRRTGRLTFSIFF